MIRQLASGLVASGGVGFYCSTAPLPSETSAGLYATLRNRSRSILSGEHEAAPETLLPVCFEPLPEQDLDNPDLWFRSNPSIDVTVPKAWLMQQHAIAKANRDPRELEDFYSQHVNAIRDTSAVGIDGWPPAREWSRWVDPGFDIDRLLDRAESTYAAVDAGGMDDLSALVVVVRDSSGRFYVWSHAWLTRHGYGAWPKNQPLYDQAVQMGELTVTNSPGEDVAAMVRVIQNLPALKGIGLDPHGIQELLAALQERGHEPVGVPQGYRLSSHAEAAERAFFSDLVTVPDYPLMRWCIGNLRQRDTGTGAKSFTKPSGTADGPEKIDIGIAMFMAWAMLSVAPPVFDPRAMIA
jgi:phage terminase large subunit-like protein